MLGDIIDDEILLRYFSNVIGVINLCNSFIFQECFSNLSLCITVGNCLMWNRQESWLEKSKCKFFFWKIGLSFLTLMTRILYHLVQSCSFNKSKRWEISLWEALFHLLQTSIEAAINLSTTEKTPLNKCQFIWKVWGTYKSLNKLSSSVLGSE